MERNLLHYTVQLSFISIGFVMFIFPLLAATDRISYSIFICVPILLIIGTTGIYTSFREIERTDFYNKIGIGGCVIGLLFMVTGTWFLISPGEKPFISYIVIFAPSVIGYGIYIVSIWLLIRTSDSVYVPNHVLNLLLLFPVLDPIFNSILASVSSMGFSITGVGWVLFGLKIKI